MTTTNSEKNLEQALNYCRENRETLLNQLIEVTKIPSVSFPGYPAEAVESSASWVLQQLESLGLDNTRLLRVDGAHPYVYGEWLNAPGKPTLLLYAHHDVQPPMREEVWQSPPFTPTQRGDRIYARGIADDKAGILIHLASIAAYLKTGGSLPVNVKVIIEGEEETGSAHLEAFAQQHADLLRSDVMVLTDCTNYDTGVPSLTTSLRGLVALEVTVSALDHPLHSGMWGGPIPDPVMGLSKILAGLVDSQGRPTAPEIWENVVPPTPEELMDLRKLNMDQKLFRQQAGVLEGVQLFGEAEELLVKIWREPSLVINSIESGGKKIAGNVLMDAAWARLGLRLAPGMDPAKCMAALKNQIESLCPWGLKLDIKEEAGVGAWRTDTSHPYFEAARKALAKGYGKDTVFIGCGGTIPFVEPLAKAFNNCPALLVGIEDPYTNAHSENESLYIPDFYRAIEGQVHLFGELGG